MGWVGWYPGGEKYKAPYGANDRINSVGYCWIISTINSKHRNRKLKSKNEGIQKIISDIYWLVWQDKLGEGGRGG